MKQYHSIVPSRLNPGDPGSELGAMSIQYLNVDSFRLLFLVGWVAMVVLQALFLFDWDAAFCATLAVAGGVIGMQYALRKDTLLRSPLSSLMLLGYTAYYFILPPLATLLEGKGLTNNLEAPVLVFLHAFACMLALIAAHLFYIGTPLPQIIRRTINERIYMPLGYFADVSMLQLFAMGALGVLSNVISASAGEIYTEETVGIVGKLVQGFYPLMYVPYCIAIFPLLGKVQRLERRHLMALLGYTVVLLFVSVARNSRGVLFSGIASLLVAYAYGVTVQLLPKPKVHIFRIAVVVLSLIAIFGPVSDFSTAMVVVRSQRTDIGAADLISATFDEYLDKDGLKQYRVESAVQNGDWDELYVDNLFLARLSNLKFADQSIGLAMALDDGGASYLRGLEWQRVMSVLPQPMIEFLGVDANKSFVTAASGGDLMLFAVTGSQYALGNFRTGSIFGSGYALFGWFYPLIFAALAVLIFAFVDAQVLQKCHLFDGHQTLQTNIFNPLCITSLFTWMFYMTSAATGIESVSGLFQFIIRGWLQVIVIYAIAYGLTRIMVKPFRGIFD